MKVPAHLGICIKTNFTSCEIIKAPLPYVSVSAAI